MKSSTAKCSGARLVFGLTLAALLLAPAVSSAQSTAAMPKPTTPTISGGRPGAPPEQPLRTEAPPLIRSDTVEERRLMMEIHEERQRLQSEAQAAREATAAREIELKFARDEVEKQAKALAAERKQLDALWSQGQAQAQKRLKELGKMYGQMDTEDAAQILASLDPALAAQILAQLKEKTAGGILGAMPADRAAMLSSTYAALLEQQSEKESP